MSKLYAGSLGDHTAVATGTAVDVSHCDELAVLISGTFVGTVKVEISADGTNWAEYDSKTAPAVVAVTVPCKQVRTRCSAFTSGTIVTTYGARNTERA